MDVVIAALVVAVISFVSGGFAIPIGFALGLDPIVVYVAASVGSMTGLIVFLYAGDKVRARITRDRPPGDLDSSSRLRELVDRHGAKGLGLIGPIFPGVTASVVIGLSLGLSRASLARWLSIGVAAMFALYTFGLWLLIELFGID